jgi:uncharacterized protein (UPF0332 family)
MFNPKFFLNLAEELKDSPRDNLFESRIRASIGRSYYSIFLATRSRIEKLIKTELENKSNIHKIIIDGLKQSSNNSLAEFGSKLDSLRQYRHQADYRVRTNLGESIATSSYKLADRLFDDLTTLPDKELKSLFQNV